eukprot:CAMPEP_0197075292 /NCGR_PEP_ID=MMETSP1384-20130603/211535_1 /TAXON_ID=29189 /ORGANISM="Ammonia sp." /LENGTH=484 /DNA_ID=CAMNT_0042514137 /DNA_START=53 /DNA_END=1507 /DNA_ORIENTATION=-
MRPSTTLRLAVVVALFIHVALCCNYYAQKSPIPPFEEVARIPLGVCTGNHYYHSKIAQESEIHFCSHDKSHIIRYKYLKSSSCTGDYQESIVTRNPSDFVCDHDETCPYVLVKMHNPDVTPTELRRWYSSAFIANHCQNNGNLYTCLDNTGYTQSKFDNADCYGYPIDVIQYLSADDDDFDDAAVAVQQQQSEAAPEQETDDVALYEIYCNQPDPTAAASSSASSVVDTPKLSEWDMIGQDDKFPVSAIETAVCLNGRTSGQHREVGDKMVAYCFNGYDVLGKPQYLGEYGEIKWTQSASTYGAAYGLFLFDEECLNGRTSGQHREVGDKMVAYCFNGYDVLGKPQYLGEYGEIKWTQSAGTYGAAYGLFLFDEEWPIAYCFGNSKDVRVCHQKWYVDHGSTARYYLDESLEVLQCECPAQRLSDGDDDDALSLLHNDDEMLQEDEEQDIGSRGSGAIPDAASWCNVNSVYMWLMAAYWAMYRL